MAPDERPEVSVGTRHVFDGLQFIMLLAAWPVAFLASALSFPALHHVSRFIVIPEEFEPAFAAAYDWIPWALILTSAALLYKALPRYRWLSLSIAVMGPIGGFCGTMSIGFFGPHPLFHGPQNAFESLSLGAPASNMPDGLPWELTRFDADMMNRVQPEWRRMGLGTYEPLTYVPSDQESAGPMILSVHPIDADTWGAAARSRRGNCYIYVMHKYYTNRDLGYGGLNSWRAQLPTDVPCRGEMATVEMAKQHELQPGQRVG